MHNGEYFHSDAGSMSTLNIKLLNNEWPLKMNLAFKPVPKVGEMDNKSFLNAYMKK